MRRGRVVGVMVSVEDYLGMRQFYADRLQKTGEQAEQKGLMEELLVDLLADES